LAVVDPAARPEVVPLDGPLGGTGRRLLAACRYFALERLSLAAGRALPLSPSACLSPQVVTCLDGHAEVTANGTTIPLAPGGTVVVPAGAARGTLRGLTPAVLLRAWVPDPAGEVAPPAPARGAGDDAPRRPAEDPGAPLRATA
jgi:hypothetical protein